MIRRTFLSMLVAIIAAAIGTMVEVSTANAQCCTFTVDVNCNLAAACFPITVKTNWSGGGLNNSQLDNVVACGPSVFGVTAIPCIPVPSLKVYSLNGGAAIPFGAPPTRVFLIPGACCVWTWATLDPAGCPIIYIVPC